MPVCNLSDLKTRLTKGQCLLGLDPGTKVIGVAISDPNFTVASPLTSIARRKFAEDAAALLKIIKARQVGGLIVGLPKNMDGTEGPAAQSARTFVSNFLKVSGKSDLAITFWDERFSSAAVERFLVSDDMSRKRRDQVIDKAAAAYILQGALDAMQAPTN